MAVRGLGRGGAAGEPASGTTMHSAMGQKGWPNGLERVGTEG